MSKVCIEMNVDSEENRGEAHTEVKIITNK